MLILIGGFEGEKPTGYFLFRGAQMPTYWQSVDQGGNILTPAILLLVLIILIGFIVMAERKRRLAYHALKVLGRRKRT